MDNEIYHHGILGMKWGVRRYQNKDGTLTNAGKKRYDKEIAKARKERDVLTNREKVKRKMDRLNALRDSNASRKRALGDDPDQDVSKTNSTKNRITNQLKKREPTNDELRSQIERIQLERQLASLQPQTVSKGRRFLSSLGNDVVAPAAKEAGKTLLTNFIKKKGTELLGLNENDADKVMNALKKEAEKAGYKKKIVDYESADLDYKGKKERWDKEHSKSEKSTSSKTEETSSSTDSSSTKTSRWKSAYSSGVSSATKRKGEETVTSLVKSDYDYKVYGEGTSRYTPKQGPIVDWEPSSKSYRSTSDVPKETLSLGQRTIAGLLEPPKEDR